ncbi:MAG: SDR family oxidoreductase [Hyphomicrobiaceae bacterium]
MDLGIKGRTAVVCASSRGLGRACAEALAAEGVNVIINGLDADRLATTLKEMQSTYDVDVNGVQADITTREGRKKLLGVCADPDILINNNKGPAPKAILETSHEDWMTAIESNMVAALMLTQAVLPAMQERRFGRIINVTSAMVTTPRAHQALSSGARSGLTAVMKGMSRDFAPYNITFNNLLPERFDTDRQKQLAERMMKLKGWTREQARADQVSQIPAGRYGQPSEFGATCAFLCSQHAGFITGMNIHLDGGAYPALV